MGSSHKTALGALPGPGIPSLPSPPAAPPKSSSEPPAPAAGTAGMGFLGGKTAFPWKILGLVCLIKAQGRVRWDRAGTGTVGAAPFPGMGMSALLPPPAQAGPKST